MEGVGLCSAGAGTAAEEDAVVYHEIPPPRGAFIGRSVVGCRDESTEEQDAELLSEIFLSDWAYCSFMIATRFDK